MVLVGIAPVIFYTINRQPVGLLQLAGAIEAVHIPVIVGLTLYMNYTFLPNKLKPSAVSLGMVLLASAVSRSLALKAEYAL